MYQNRKKRKIKTESYNKKGDESWLYGSPLRSYSSFTYPMDTATGELVSSQYIFYKVYINLYRQ